MKSKTIILGSIWLFQLTTWPALTEAQSASDTSESFSIACATPPKGTVLENPSSCLPSLFLGGRGNLKLGIAYYAPSMHGREIFGNLVPYGEVWRTGDHAAPSFKTGTDIWIGDLKVPAGTYTLFSLPSPNGWQLIVSKQIGQWGSDYDERQDLGRVNMQTAPRPPYPVETLTIKIVNHSHTRDLHLVWENTDVYVPIAPQYPVTSKPAIENATPAPGN